MGGRWMPLGEGPVFVISLLAWTVVFDLNIVFSCFSAKIRMWLVLVGVSCHGLEASVQTLINISKLLVRCFEFPTTPLALIYNALMNHISLFCNKHLESYDNAVLKMNAEKIWLSANQIEKFMCLSWINH